MAARKKQPAFLFYPGDWLKDPALRRVPLEARAVWLDMLCLMHESPQYGRLCDERGNPWSDDELIGAISGDPATIRFAIGLLEAKGVFSRDSRGVIFCRRWVREAELSTKRSEAGKAGAASRYGKRGKPSSRKHNPDESTDKNTLPFCQTFASDFAMANVESENGNVFKGVQGGIDVWVDAMIRQFPFLANPAEESRLFGIIGRIAELGGAPGEVPGAASQYSDQWPRAVLTPEALAKHWSQLTSKSSSANRKAALRDERASARGLVQELESMSTTGLETMLAQIAGGRPVGPDQNGIAGDPGIIQRVAWIKSILARRAGSEKNTPGGHETTGGELPGD